MRVGMLKPYRSWPRHVECLLYLPLQKWLALFVVFAIWPCINGSSRDQPIRVRPAAPILGRCSSAKRDARVKCVAASWKPPMLVAFGFFCACLALCGSMFFFCRVHHRRALRASSPTRPSHVCYMRMYVSEHTTVRCGLCTHTYSVCMKRNAATTSDEHSRGLSRNPFCDVCGKACFDDDDGDEDAMTMIGEKLHWMQSAGEGRISGCI